MNVHRDEIRRRPFLLRPFLIVGVVLIVSFAGAYRFVIDTEAAAARQTAYELSCQEVRNLLDVRQSGQLAALQDYLRRRPQDFRYYFRDPFGKQYFDLSLGALKAQPDFACLNKLSPGKIAELKKYGHRPFFETIEFRTGGRPLELVRLRLSEPGGTTSEIDVAHSVSAITELLALLGFAGLLSLGTVLATGLIAQRALERRIAVLNRVSETFAAGDRSARAPSDRIGDDLTDLGRHLNSALSRIQGLIDEQQRLNQRIAHDFRRPLTGVLLDLDEVMERDTDEKTLSSLRSIKDRVLDLRTAFEGTLEVSHNELETIDLSDLVESIFLDFSPKARQKGLRLTRKIVPGIRTVGSRYSAASLFENLVDNAIKYTPSGSVEIELERETGQFVFRIRDSGPGLKEDIAKDLLRPFRREEKTKGIDGHGLGLAFVVNAVLRHGFSLNYRNLEPGLEFVIGGTLADRDLPPLS